MWLKEEEKVSGRRRARTLTERCDGKQGDLGHETIRFASTRGVHCHAQAALVDSVEMLPGSIA